MPGQLNPENMATNQETENYQEAFQRIEQEPALDFVWKLIAAFPEAEVFLVGGINRDVVIGRESKDYDLVVRNIEPERLEKFLQEFGEINLVGRNFGIFKFVPRGMKVEIDVALPRTEHASVESLGGYRDFDVQADPKLPIEDDLSRRDFTINAMAWDIKNKRMIDPYHGLADIAKREIRAVGDPQERFREDYSRMLRAMRFACQLDFNIEEQTWQSITKSMAKINAERKVAGEKTERVVPYETVARELVKAFLANPAKALDLYDKSGAFQELAPEFLAMKNCPQPPQFHSEGDVWVHTRLALKKLSSPEFLAEFSAEGGSLPKADGPRAHASGEGNASLNSELILAVLLHDIGKPATLKTPERDGTERIRFNEHAQEGSKLANTICRRLKIVSVPGLNIKLKRIRWLIESHMLFMQGDISQMRNSTIAKYFDDDYFNGDDLLKLTFVDSLATVPPNGQPDMTNFQNAKERIRQYRAWSKKHKALAKKSLIPGEQIMALFALDERHDGPKIGYLDFVLRRAQQNQEITTPEEAEALLKEEFQRIEGWSLDETREQVKKLKQAI